METQKEYHYTYYSYEEWGKGYFGSRTCECLPEDDIKYFGSFADKTFNPTHKIIIKDDYSTRAEADADEILLHDYFEVDINPHFANRARQTSTKFRLPKEKAVEIGRVNGKKSKELGVGVHGRTKEQMTEDGKKGAQKVKELGIGIFSLTSEELSASAKKAYANGLAKLPKEVRSEYGRMGARTQMKNGTGIFSLTPEQKSELAKRNNAQKWMCLETGYVSNSGGLSKYQKAKNIDTSKRKRIS